MINPCYIVTLLCINDDIALPNTIVSIDIIIIGTEIMAAVDDCIWTSKLDENTGSCLELENHCVILLPDPIKDKPNKIPNE